MGLLFNRIDVFSVSEHCKQELKGAFQKVSNEEIDSDPIAVAGRLIEDFSLDVPVLEEDKKYATTKEVQVDVSRDPRRFITDRSRPFYINGTEIRIIVPFQGDPGMFGVQPSSFTLNPPRGEIVGHELHLPYQLTDASFDLEADAKRTIAQINQYLGNLRTSAQQIKLEIQQLVNSLFEQRKRERGTHAQIVAKLSIPVKEAAKPDTSGVVSPAGKRPMPKGSSDQAGWDVFISHASEDKDAIATPLANALRKSGLEVWYDDFSLKIGDSLRESIDKGLAGSRFGVVILSPHFFGKHWPQTELNGLATRETDGSKVILPVWHGVGFAEVRGYSVTLADRKAAQTRDGLQRVIHQIVEAVRSPEPGSAK
jgi:hypothetical protein